MKTENWHWDGNDLWHFGDSYEGENAHRYVGIGRNSNLRDSPLLKRDAKLITLVPQMVTLLLQLDDPLADEIRKIIGE